MICILSNRFFFLFCLLCYSLAFEDCQAQSLGDPAGTTNALSDQRTATSSTLPPGRIPFPYPGEPCFPQMAEASRIAGNVPYTMGCYLYDQEKLIWGFSVQGRDACGDSAFYWSDDQPEECAELAYQFCLQTLTDSCDAYGSLVDGRKGKFTKRYWW